MSEGKRWKGRVRVIFIEREGGSKVYQVQTRFGLRGFGFWEDADIETYGNARFNRLTDAVAMADGLYIPPVVRKMVEAE